LEHSLRQPEWYIWQMPFWHSKKRVNQIIAFEKEQEAKMKENRPKSGSKPRK